MIDFSRAYRGKWMPALEVARDFVNKSTLPVTLRQVFYALVSRQLLENTESNYRRLSAITAEERRHGTFPALVDNGREIHRAYAEISPEQALMTTANYYQSDHTEGQAFQIFLVAEKRGMTAALRQSFGKYGVSVLGLGGYASQTLLDDVSAQIRADGRPAIGIYAGDFDPTGQDIPRHFIEGCGPWADWVQIALTAEQVDTYNLPENPGKTTDARAAAFEARNGKLVQVEVDALDPALLDSLYRAAFAKFWDKSHFEHVIAREQQQRELMREFASQWPEFERATR